MLNGANLSTSCNSLPNSIDVIPSKETRTELLGWLNSAIPKTAIPAQKVEQCGNGVAYALLLSNILPVPYPPLQTKLKTQAKIEFESVSNLKLIQEALQRNSIPRPSVLVNEMDKLIKGNFQANLQLLQWFRGLYIALTESDEKNLNSARHPKSQKLEETKNDEFISSPPHDSHSGEKGELKSSLFPSPSLIQSSTAANDRAPVDIPPLPAKTGMNPTHLSSKQTDTPVNAKDSRVSSRDPSFSREVRVLSVVKKTSGGSHPNQSNSISNTNNSNSSNATTSLNSANTATNTNNQKNGISTVIRTRSVRTGSARNTSVKAHQPASSSAAEPEHKAAMTEEKKSRLRVRNLSQRPQSVQKPSGPLFNSNHRSYTPTPLSRATPTLSQRTHTPDVQRRSTTPKSKQKEGLSSLQGSRRGTPTKATVRGNQVSHNPVVDSISRKKCLTTLMVESKEEEADVTALSEELLQVRMERQFYYDKLRIIERLVSDALRTSGTNGAFARSVQDVLYANN